MCLLALRLVGTIDQLACDLALMKELRMLGVEKYGLCALGNGKCENRSTPTSIRDFVKTLVTCTEHEVLRHCQDPKGHW